MVDVKHVLPD